MMSKLFLLASLLLLAFLLNGCGQKKLPHAEDLPGIEWDASSLRQISEPGDLAYNGYPRLIQLKDGSLFSVYFNSANGIMARKSTDYGNTWGAAYLILPNSLSHKMDNPEILQLQDGSLLVSTNLRPVNGEKNQDQTSHFQIGVSKSSDGGSIWSPLQILYTASWKFQDGCWEPKAIQLPSDEIQVYFANEAPFTSSDEQNISMLSSTTAVRPGLWSRWWFHFESSSETGCLPPWFCWVALKS